MRTERCATRASEAMATPHLMPPTEQRTERFWAANRSAIRQDTESHRSQP